MHFDCFVQVASYFQSCLLDRFGAMFYHQVDLFEVEVFQALCFEFFLDFNFQAEVMIVQVLS